MGVGSFCKIGMTAKNSELLINPYDITEFTHSGKSSDLEVVFESLYEKLIFPNESIMIKWKTLPKFVYNNSEDYEYISLVENNINEDGEHYYGFMYD